MDSNQGEWRTQGEQPPCKEVAGDGVRAGRRRQKAKWFKEGKSEEVWIRTIFWRKSGISFPGNILQELLTSTGWFQYSCVWEAQNGICPFYTLWFHYPRSVNGINRVIPNYVTINYSAVFSLKSNDKFLSRAPKLKYSKWAQIPKLQSLN